MHILTQLLTILSNYCEAWSTEKRNIILCKIASSFFKALSLVLVGSIAGSLPVFFTIARNIVCFFQDRFKTKLPLYLICFGYVAIGIGSIPLYTSILDAFPAVSSLISTIILWFGSPVEIKMGVSLGDILWMLYDFVNGLYLAALNMLCRVIVTGISVIRIKRQQKMEKNASADAPHSER